MNLFKSKQEDEVDVIVSDDVQIKEKSFASGINFYKLFWIFIIGCVIGVIIETVVCYSKSGIIESRKGLIYGPFSPVYGFGAVVFTILLYKIRNISSVFIFIISAVAGGAFEFFCSWIQEVFLGTISWEYSDLPVNFQGRTNLMYSMCWGVLGMVFIKHIYPFISRQLEKIPNKTGVILSWVLFVFMVFNFLISCCAVRRYVQRNYDIPAKNEFQRFIDNTYTDEYLKKVYPNMIIL